MKHVAFISLYPEGRAPGPRFRYEQYISLLKEHGIEYTVLPFFSDKSYANIQQSKNKRKLAFDIFVGYIRRLADLPACLKADYIFLYRDATPFGPPIFEWMLSKIFRKKIVYDFDDAIWTTDLDKKQWLKIWLRSPSKTNKIIKWAWKISAGNDYLCNYAKQFNSNVVLNPTTIDTERLHNKIKNQKTSRLVIGWTGSHSTLKYLDPMVDILAKLEQEFEFDFLVICDKKPAWTLKSLRFLPWKIDTEIQDLSSMNFGLMPLPDDEWAKGKCGFKALQYMALGMPAVVSPVGVNTEIVDDGINGFVCQTNEEWEIAIRKLLRDETLRTQMGENARMKIVRKFSVLSNTGNFVSLFH